MGEERYFKLEMPPGICSFTRGSGYFPELFDGRGEFMGVKKEPDHTGISDMDCYPKPLMVEDIQTLLSLS